LGESQGWKSASWVESRRHSKLDPGSEAEKENDGEASLVGPEGPESIVVWGIVALPAAATKLKPSTAAIASKARTGFRRCGLGGD
jgi:hypothetical protein